MKQDLKDSSFSFKKIRKQRLKRKFRISLLIILIICIYFLVSLILAAQKCKIAEKNLLSGKVKKSETILKKVTTPLIFSKRKKIIIALIALYRNDFNKSKQIFNNLHSPNQSTPHNQFLDYFISKAEYKKTEIYLEFLQKGEDEYSFYSAILNTARLNAIGSKEAILSINNTDQTQIHTKKIQILKKINKNLDSNLIEYIFDKNNKPLAAFDLKSNSTISYTPGFDFTDFSTEIIKKGLRYYSLSLNLIIQKKIDQLFKKYYGSFILIDLFDSSISAAYSKPKSKTKGNSVFLSLSEPGSVIKLITLFSYLDNMDNNLFPYQCDKPLNINNRLFYDWTRHGTIKTYVQALTQSCNLAFAKMAILLGQDKLFSTFHSFLLNTNDIKDHFLTFKLGEYKNNVDPYSFVRQSVGLSPLKSTTFYCGLFTAIIARNGSLYSPFIIHNIKDIFQVPFYNHKPFHLDLFENKNILFLKIKNAMVNVVNSPKGTGKRSKVHFVQTAIKTGTTGSRKKGQDSVIVGFFPAEKPKYAFGFRLIHAGRAELNGAVFLRDFLISIYKN